MRTSVSQWENVDNTVLIHPTVCNIFAFFPLLKKTIVYRHCCQKKKQNNMTKIQSILLLAFIVGTFAACRNDGNNQRFADGQDEPAAQDARLAPGEYRTDDPDDLTAYFQTLCSEWGAVVAVHSSDPQDSLAIWNAIRLLDDYAAGRREFYPADEVRGEDPQLDTAVKELLKNNSKKEQKQ